MVVCETAVDETIKSTKKSRFVSGLFFSVLPMYLFADLRFARSNRGQQGESLMRKTKQKSRAKVQPSEGLLASAAECSPPSVEERVPVLALQCCNP